MGDIHDRGTAHPASRLAEDAQKAVGHIASLSAGDMIQWTIAGLAEKAWECMGLVADCTTGSIMRDFEDARPATHAVAALVDLRPRASTLQAPVARRGYSRTCSSITPPNAPALNQAPQEGNTFPLSGGLGRGG